MIKKKFFLSFMLLVIFVLSCFCVSAISIAINPASLDDTDMVRGGYTEKIVKVSTKEESGRVTMYFSNKSKEINNWITFTPSERTFNISNNNPRNVKISIEPPEDTPNGVYTTEVIFSIKNTAVATGFTGAVIDTAVAFRIRIQVIDEEVIACNVRSLSIPSVEKGNEWISVYSIINQGNVRLAPTILLEIWNQQKSELVKTIEYRDEQILPTVTDSISIEQFTSDFDVGQYFVDVKIPECNYESSQTFDILKPGTISSEGKLVGIRIPAWNNISDTVLITPIFENTGEKNVEAKFKGVIKLNGVIKKTIETEVLSVKPSSRIEFEEYYVPKEAGRYDVSGRVFFDDKRTFEKTNRFNVLNKVSENKSTGFDLMYVIVGLVILSFILLILIKKKKMNKKRRHYHRHH